MQKKAAFVITCILASASHIAAAQNSGPPAPARVLTNCDLLCPEEKMALTFIPSTTPLFDFTQALVSGQNYGSDGADNARISNFKPLIYVVVQEDGSVKDAKIRETSGNSLLNKELVRWAYQLKFLPDSCRVTRARYTFLPVDLSSAER